MRSCQYDKFAEISGTQVYEMPATNKQAEPRQFWNKQNILNPQSKFYDKTAIAGKNGYTSQAGHTLVTVARRDGVTLIAVTMGSVESKYDKHRDTVARFAYGYDQFEKATLSAANVAAAAKQAGLSPDEGAMAPTMVLLPKGKSTADLQFTGAGKCAVHCLRRGSPADAGCTGTTSRCGRFCGKKHYRRQRGLSNSPQSGQTACRKRSGTSARWFWRCCLHS